MMVILFLEQNKDRVELEDVQTEKQEFGRP